MSIKRQMAEDEGFLGRWSRLKRERPAPASAVVAPEPKLPEVQIDAQEAHPVDETPQEPLPEIDALGAGSDFKPFMNPRVAPEMRAQALRKLWASNPLYNHIDMLDDYCEDYTDAAVCIPGMKTAYKIGRGFLKDLEEVTEEPSIENPAELDESEVALTEHDQDNDQS